MSAPAPARRGVQRNTHLFVLCAFAIAQPLFAKLGPAPGYFAAHSLGSYDIVWFAVALVVVPPLVLMLVEAIAGIAGRRARWAVHLLIVAALAALIILPPLGGLTSVLAYALAALIGVGFAYAYARWRGVRTVLSVLVVAPLLFVLVFLFASPTRHLVSGDSSDAWQASNSFRPPIVFIQFDALPSLLLETPDRQVDAKRFPNLAKLARDGVWYRNATNVHENTVFSVPSFVDGKLPRKGITPTVQDHYPNLFTVLGPSYRMNVAEEATSLCPYEYCRDGGAQPATFLDDTRVVFNQIVRPEDDRDNLPSISDRWRAFESGPLQASFKTRKKTPEFVIRHLHSGRIGRFERWLDKVGSGGNFPELDYIHMFLPHEPREFIPDGRRYVTPDSALEGPPAYDNRFLSAQGEQRTILQLGYTDRVVGQVMAKLKRLGIYDDALVVVVADHGESFLPEKATPAGPFVPGHLGYRRAVNRRNLADISSIPMFIKYPKGHGPAGTDDRLVRSVDVFPTILGRLAIAPPRIDGRDMNDDGYRGNRSVSVATTFDGVVRMGVRSWQRERGVSLRRRLRLFGSGSRSVYKDGPRPDIVGRPVADFEFSPTPATPVHATVDGADRFRDVNPVAAVCLCQIAGRIEDADPEGMPLAVAINGRIAATGVGFADRGKKKLNWAVMVPPNAYHDGANTVQVLRITGARKLEAIGGAT
jgi:Sulfatase